MDLYLIEGGGVGGVGEGERTPDNQPENRSHILEVKLHRSNRDSNPRPRTLVTSSLGGTGAGCNPLSHWLPYVTLSTMLGLKSHRQ